MEIDELIAIAEYKSKNIKAHISPATMEEITTCLKEYKKLKNGEGDCIKPVSNLNFKTLAP